MKDESVGSLALSRKLNETVVLTLEDGRTIDVTLAMIGRDRVRLVFRAPKTINIIRKEVVCKSESKTEKSEPASASGSKTPSV